MSALTVMDGERPTGCIINTAVQVTSDNPTIAISVNKNNYTFTALDTANGLPMFYRDRVEIDVATDADDNPQTLPGHAGHTINLRLAVLAGK